MCTINTFFVLSFISLFVTGIILGVIGSSHDNYTLQLAGGIIFGISVLYGSILSLIKCIHENKCCKRRYEEI